MLMLGLSIFIFSLISDLLYSLFNDKKHDRDTVSKHNNSGNKRK